MSETVLIDSWAWIEIFNDTPKGRQVQERYENAKKIISAINVYEVYRKFLLQDEEQAIIARNKMLASSSAVAEVTVELALRAAEFRKKYPLLSMADAIILATAEQEKAVLVTGDPDFENVKEVKVVLI